MSQQNRNLGLISVQAYQQAQEEAYRYNMNQYNKCLRWNNQHPTSDLVRRPIYKSPEDILREKY